MTRKHRTVQTVATDAAGQPGGPSADEQARVDQEQRYLMARMAEERRPQEEADRLAMQEKLQRALDGEAERRSLVARLKVLEARVTVLEARQ